MPHTRMLSPDTIPRDLAAGAVVFLVAVPMCLGVALASDAPLFSGLVAGIVGGLIVGSLSGSHTAVSGPAAGLTAVVVMQIAALGSFKTFLLAVVVAGLFQILLGAIRGGLISAFFPTSVVKGLLAAIGVILVLKQIPHLLGRDADPEGDMSFFQVDHENTLSELGEVIAGFHPGAAIVGLATLGLLVLWDLRPELKRSAVPSSLVAAVFGVALSFVLRPLGDSWTISGVHLVQAPVAKDFGEFFRFFELPDFSHWRDPAVYVGGLTIALVASLETLLTLGAVDKIDPRQRTSPPNRELLAQGVGNIACGLLGGIPLTAVVVRSSVAINAGSRSKLTTIVHGGMLLVCVAFFPRWLNVIPISCLAAILLHTGAKLASPALVRSMWRAGYYQFVPFFATIVGIVFSNLLIGLAIGFAVSVAFILNSNLRRPMRRVVERHLGGDVLHIELANQVTFLNRAALAKTLAETPRGGHVLLDAQNTDYIDPDVLDLIQDYRTKTAPARGVQVSMIGFRDKYQINDQIQYVDYSTRDLQNAATPAQVLEILRAGHQRFRSGQRLTRDLVRQVGATAAGQHPLAVVLSCIDSRTPAELIFDLGMGDIFSVRVAGNITSRKVLGSIEYGCAVAGAKLVVVMGHTRCGAVKAAVQLVCSTDPVAEATGCQHVEFIVQDIQESMDEDLRAQICRMSDKEQAVVADQVARANVLRSLARMLDQSQTLADLAASGRIAIVGALYDVVTGDIEFLSPDGAAVAAAERIA